MGNYAIIDENGNVTNIVVLDNVTPWISPEGATAVSCNGNPLAQIGGTWEEGTFTPAPIVNFP